MFDFDFYATDTDVVIITSDGIVTDAATHAALMPFAGWVPADWN